MSILDNLNYGAINNCPDICNKDRYINEDYRLSFCAALIEGAVEGGWDSRKFTDVRINTIDRREYSVEQKPRVWECIVAWFYGTKTCGKVHS